MGQAINDGRSVAFWLLVVSPWYYDILCLITTPRSFPWLVIGCFPMIGNSYPWPKRTFYSLQQVSSRFRSPILIHFVSQIHADHDQMCKCTLPSAVWSGPRYRFLGHVSRVAMESMKESTKKQRTESIFPALQFCLVSGIFQDTATGYQNATQIWPWLLSFLWLLCFLKLRLFLRSIITNSNNHLWHQYIV